MQKLFRLQFASYLSLALSANEKHYLVYFTLSHPKDPDLVLDVVTEQIAFFSLWYPVK